MTGHNATNGLAPWFYAVGSPFNHKGCIMILYPKGEVTMQTMVFLVRARLDGFCLTSHIRDVSRAGSPPQGQQRYGPPSQGANQQMFFQYSQCIGRKKALCV